MSTWEIEIHVEQNPHIDQLRSLTELQDFSDLLVQEVAQITSQEVSVQEGDFATESPQGDVSFNLELNADADYLSIMGIISEIIEYLDSTCESGTPHHLANVEVRYMPDIESGEGVMVFQVSPIYDGSEDSWEYVHMPAGRFPADTKYHDLLADKLHMCISNISLKTSEGDIDNAVSDLNRAWKESTGIDIDFSNLNQETEEGSPTVVLYGRFPIMIFDELKDSNKIISDFAFNMLNQKSEYDQSLDKGIPADGKIGPFFHDFRFNMDKMNAAKPRQVIQITSEYKVHPSLT